VSTVFVDSGELFLGGWVLLAGGYAAEVLNARRNPELAGELQREQAG
jgi:hypothetical protein